MEQELASGPEPTVEAPPPAAVAPPPHPPPPPSLLKSSQFTETETLTWMMKRLQTNSLPTHNIS